MSNVPKLRFKEFSGGWEEKELSYLISSLDAGVSVNSMDVIAKEGEKAILKTSCVSNGSFDISENKLVSDDSEIQRLKEPVKANTIIISRMNTPNLVGANAFINSDNDNIYLPDRLWSAKIKDTASAKWTSILIASPKIRTLLSSRATGTSNSMKNITKGDVLTLPVTITSKQEQEKIASFLTSVDTKIEQLTKKESLLQEYKKGVMQKIFNQEIRFKDDDGSEFCDWKKEKLSNLFLNIGGTPLEKFTDENASYKFISIGNYSRDGKYIDNRQRIILNDKTETKLLEKDNLVMVLNDKTSTGDIIGSTILIDENNKYIYNQRSERLICKKNISSLFYWHYFNSKLFRKKFFSMSQGGTQIYVNFSVIKLLDIPFPLLKEQTKIANFLSKIDNKIEQTQKQLKQTKEFKKALLQQMFI